MSIRMFMAVAVAVGLLGGGPLAPSARAAEVLKLSHTTIESNPWHKGALRFAELVNAKTGGAVQVQIFPNNQLGSEREILTLMRSGAVDMGFDTVGAVGTFVQAMNIFNLPFLFKTEQEAAEFSRGPLAAKLLASCDRAGYRCLAFHSSFFRYPMNNKRPLQSLADFRGLKIRTMEVPPHVDTYRALGASPTPIPFGDLYNALALGTVDGNENTVVTLEGLKIYEVQRYISLIPILTTTGVVIVGKKTWDRLSPAHQGVVEAAAREAAEVIDRAFTEAGEKSLGIMKAKGVQVDAGPPDLTPFRKAAQPVYDKYIPTLPKEAQEVARELLKAWQ